MRKRFVVGSTEARKRFFELLRLADGGHEVYVEKKDNRRTYRIIRTKLRPEDVKKY